MDISFTESALGDLQAIRDWYADQGVPESGARLVEQILDRVQNLAAHPAMGRVVPEFDQAFLREIINPPFRIVYRHETGRVRVVRIWRGERLLELPAVDDDELIATPD